jgi:DNA-directed RNA polymerase sigma subunit (sigma70/sigma32)
VNQQSLERANAFLAAVASRVRPGEVLEVSPADIARDMGLPEPLAAARAVRALLARRRLEMVDGKYRLVDSRPIEAGEREQVPRPRRPRSSRPTADEHPAPQSRPTYSEIGREAIERMIELGRDVGSLRAGLRTAREEARESREARDDAERRAHALASRVRDLEARAEMAESNLRTLLSAARASGRDIPVGDTEMEAILGVLKGDHEEEEHSAKA